MGSLELLLLPELQEILNECKEKLDLFISIETLKEQFSLILKLNFGGKFGLVEI